jgi:ribosomal RNA-processing protein 12
LADSSSGDGVFSFFQSITTSVVGETLLCLKDTNAKTRQEAYSLLLALCRLHGDTPHFIQVVAAAIGSNTSHMRSAAVTALARLVFEFSSKDDDVQIMIPALLKTVLMLSDDPSREVTKSMILFVRVAITMSTSSQLEPLLSDILGGLLKYHRGKDRFRSKIKIIIKKLVKIFGYDALTPMVPPTDARLLTHMRKLDERETRRKQSSSYQPIEEMVGYDAMEDSEGEEDSDDGITLVTGMTRKSRITRLTSQSRQTHRKRNADAMSSARSTKRSVQGHASIRIKNDADGEVLDVSELKTVTFADASNSDDDMSDEEVEFDASGKLVVRDVHDRLSMDMGQDDVGMHDLLRGKRTTTIRSGNASRKRGVTATNDYKKKVTARPGQAYKAKKAGGDTKKKGQKYEPYAYMQLDGRSYTRKNRRHAVEQMGSIVERGRKRQKR